MGKKRHDRLVVTLTSDFFTKRAAWQTSHTGCLITPTESRTGNRTACAERGLSVGICGDCTPVRPEFSGREFFPEGQNLAAG
ncbi:MAG: hypothetical protein QUS33_11975, partial [Dehalococcoidia bacterium]|nr:hypothetical protein [Dehalococcoidia bacterium]